MLTIKCFQFSPIQENTYLLYNEFNNCIIIDPGCYFEEEREILAQFILSNQLKPQILLNTHCHLDHVFGNKFISETYKLTPQIHPNEKQVLDYAPTSGLMYNMPFDNYNGPLKYIEAGEKVQMDNDELISIFTPGHSPGSLSFYCKSQNFIIGGDVLFHRSIGRTDLPGGNLDTLISSIKNELFVLPDETIVYSGHGEKTNIGDEKKANPYLR
ncbi:MAG: MBL fold metallo-hydrolase [Sphingobacteriales bacterium]|nr:MBL fold metallo-hydrolase [Sphingobacteriales bacterium]